MSVQENRVYHFESHASELEIVELLQKNEEAGYNKTNFYLINCFRF